MSKYRNVATLIQALLSVTLLLTVRTGTAAEEHPVRIKPFTALAVHAQSSAPATVVSSNDSPIGALIDALVLAIPVRVGDSVRTGDVLVQLDCKDIELDRARLQGERQSQQARLELAEWEFRQTELLAKQQSVPQEQIHTKRSQLNALRGELAANNARLATTDRQINHCTVKAPYAGVITARTVSVGQFAARGTALVRLLDVTGSEVSAQISSRDVPRLQQLADADFEHDGQHYPLRVRTVLPVIHPETGSQEMRLEFRNKHAEPGAAGRLLWQDRTSYLPPDIIVKRGTELGVFIAQGNIAHFHPIAEAVSGRPAPIQLPDNTTIVVSGQFVLTEGAAIRIEQEPGSDSDGHVVK